MDDLAGRTAVITGAASGFGLELSKLTARARMNVVMCDVRQDALDAAAAQVAADCAASGDAVLAFSADVSSGDQIEALARATLDRYGTPHLVVNNAGVMSGGLIWEHSAQEWERVLGINLMGVAHGVRVFTPLMLEAARRDAAWRGHIVNTASMAGLVNMPNMGAYNVSKHAVVSISETLFHDLALVTDQIRCSVLCPYFVPTGIADPAHTPSAGAATRSQQVAAAIAAKAVASGKLSAADIAHKVMAAVASDSFYVFSHPRALGAVGTRMNDILQGRNPSDPFADRPHLRRQLRDALCPDSGE